MIRILFYVLVVLAIGAGFAWLADRPGELAIVWQGQRIEMTLMVAASIFVTLIAAVLITLWLVRSLWLSPHTISRYFRARRRDRGYQALSTGLIAAGAGDAILARKMAVRTRGLIRADQEPLIHLLEAQTALIEGRHDDARKKFETMADDPETRELGLRGLYLEARRQEAHEAARHYAERAADNAPHLAWATLAALEHRGRTGQWDEAIRLVDQARSAHAIEKAEAYRKKAVLLTARATERLDADPKGARDDALAALKLAPDLVPAGLVAARALNREDNLRKAAGILEKLWKATAHPDVASLYIRARNGDSALDRLKRANKLEAIRPNSPAALIAVARAALDARELLLAREKAEAAARIAPSEGVFLLLADIEEADTSDIGRIRYWMAQALRSPGDAAWTADGVTAAEWRPVSPVTGRLDAFEWKTPVSQIDGPVEEGSVNPAEEAIRNLPPVTPAPAPVETVRIVEVEKPVVVSVERPAEPTSEMAATAPPPAAEPQPAVPVKAVPPEDGKRDETVVEPFFGRPPDDPGVRDPKAAEQQALRLF
ncbi:heme biosynthesis protein HemY [Ensifer soli]|uniref:heme biosynthesis protein HemY n=1 Tax=Ciceribacter sp. sgz301302 TaxID=3342379 RepID=UPI0035B7D1A2